MGQPATALHTPYPHIHVDAAGVAWVEGTAVKVLEIVLDRQTHGWSPEEVHFQHPDLSLAQIHSALAWYYDHQNEVDAQIEQRLAYVDAMMKAASPSPLQARLRALGRLK
jgi:uncharacterized protein (DUF433 family)